MSAPEPTETWRDVVRDVHADVVGGAPLSDVDCDYILWEHTAFPLDDKAAVTAALKFYFQEVFES